MFVIVYWYYLPNFHSLTLGNRLVHTINNNPIYKTPRALASEVLKLRNFLADIDNICTLLLPTL